MAIVALVLWMFTAGAGFYLLVTSNLGRARPAVPEPAAAQAASVAQAAAAELSRREMRRATRDRWDPPSLTAAKSAPMVPGAGSVLEFAHPACALVGLGFWLGFTLVHNRALGWIAFGLIAVTACLGLSWVMVNVRVARRDAADKDAGDKDAADKDSSDKAAADKSAPRFSGRLMIVHGSAAALTIVLAALSALVVRG
jgi:hypothetical protein